MLSFGMAQKMAAKLTQQVWEALSPEVRDAVAATRTVVARENRSAAAQKRVRARGLNLQLKPCGDCGELYQPTGGRQLLCSPCKTGRQSADRCAEWREKITVANRERWAAGAVKFADRLCGACDLSYMPRSGRQRWCSDDCKQTMVRLGAYGLDVRDYRRMLVEQGHLCALCRKEASGFSTAYSHRLVVDHCHATGKVRGLLCGDCNTAIGRFGDDPARLRAAADYLER